MRTPSKRIWILRIASLAGLILSIISLIHFLTLAFGLNEGGSFCNINESFNCDAVNASRWSQFLGLPLAAYGAAFYVFVISISFVGEAYVRRRILLLFSLISVVFSLYLFYVSEFLIGTLCIMCLGMYAANFVILITAWLLKKELPITKPSLSELFKKGFFGVVVSGCLALMVLTNVTRLFSAILVNSNSFYISWNKQQVENVKISKGGALEKDYFKGPEDAPISIIEFSDLECSACRRFYLTLESVLPAYKDKVKITFKNFPLDRACNSMIKRDMHQNACYAAVFSRCAGEQDKFWQVVDYIYNLNYAISGTNPNFIKNSLESSYSLLGLDIAAINECIQSGRYDSKIQSDISEARAMELHSTPSVWINGRRLNVFSDEALKTIFHALLHK